MLTPWRPGDPKRREQPHDVFERRGGRWHWVGTMRSAEHAQRAAAAVTAEAGQEIRESGP